MSAMSSDFVFSAQSDFNLDTTKKPPDLHKPPTPKLFFRDKLLGPTQDIQHREKEDMIEKKLVRIELENGNRLLPKVYIEPKVFQELCTPWKDAIVVKLLGKNLGYNTMRDRLQKIWKLQGGFEIMDNDNGFYMVKFDLAADKEKVITGGPWLIFDHCLAVSHWSPEFASLEAKVDRTVVWVRFSGLNLVYYDESFLLAMASAIGRPIKVDTNTLRVERGKFARVCVEIDLTAPVVGKIWVNGHWYKVQYEGLHLICTSCGCYGHLGRNCTTTAASAGATLPPSHPAVAATHEGAIQSDPTNQLHLIMDSQNGNKSFTPPIVLSLDTRKIIAINEGNENLHGDWLVVTRKNKKPINSPYTQKTVTQKSNRFSLLSNSSHKVKPGPQPTKFPAHPKTADTARASSSNHDTKRRRSDDIYHDQTSEFQFELSPSGPTRTPNPGKATHVTYTHMGSTSTKQPPRPNNTNKKETITIPTPEPTSHMPNPINHQPDTNSNDHDITTIPVITTKHENIQVVQGAAEDQGQTNADEHDSNEEDMVT